jgi:hypothetical protein
MQSLEFVSQMANFPSAIEDQQHVRFVIHIRSIKRLRTAEHEVRKLLDFGHSHTIAGYFHGKLDPTLFRSAALGFKRHQSGQWQLIRPDRQASHLIELMEI